MILENNRLNLSQLNIGSPLPDWSSESIFEGEELPSKANYLGKPLLLLFFSLGCPGCLGRAIPYANRIVFENGRTFKQGVNFEYKSRFIFNKKTIR